MLQHGSRSKWKKNRTVSTVSISKLPRSFYLRPTLTVAKDLLGKYLCRRLRGELLIGRIVEVEAYLGERDPASHAYNGRTHRNEVMFGNGGHLYVYFTYGMHFCANVVTEKEGIAHAVLIRAIEPIEGIETMKKNRGLDKWMSGSMENLTNGPAKLCQALGIARAQNGTDLCNDIIFLSKGESVPKYQIISTPRIGITKAVEKKWRFTIEGN